MAYSLDEFASNLRDDRQRRAFDYWRSKAPEGRLPARRNIDPIEIPDLLPWLTLIDAIWEGDDEGEGKADGNEEGNAVKRPRLRLRCRLIGTEVVARFGRDITGLYAEEAYPEEYLNKALETYGAIIESRRPHLSRHRFPIKGREHGAYDRLILPLAKDGDTVDMFMICFVFDVRDDDWSSAAGPDNAI